MEPIEQKIHSLFIEKKWTLGLAESCSGGTVSHLLVQIPGCSLYFQGSIVAYSYKAKQKLLNVSEQTLKEHGAVSEKTALEMAQGALAVFDADFALSTTGIAGPSGGSKEKPVGLVCFAVASKKYRFQTWQERFTGERRGVIKNSAYSGLQGLFKFVNSL